MQAWQERVVSEKTDLDNKLVALDAFIGGDRFETVNEGERQRLVSQRYYMRGYSEVLGNRVAAFTEEDS